MSIVGALGQQDALILSLKDDHRPGHEHEVVAYSLSQLPKVGVSVCHVGGAARLTPTRSAISSHFQ